MDPSLEEWFTRYAQLLDFKEEKNEVFINMIGRQHVTVEELVHFSPVTTGVVYFHLNECMTVGLSLL